MVKNPGTNRQLERNQARNRRPAQRINEIREDEDFGDMDIVPERERSSSRPLERKQIQDFDMNLAKAYQSRNVENNPVFTDLALSNSAFMSSQGVNDVNDIPPNFERLPNESDAEYINRWNKYILGLNQQAEIDNYKREYRAGVNENEDREFYRIISDGLTNMQAEKLIAEFINNLRNKVDSFMYFSDAMPNDNAGYLAWNQDNFADEDVVLDYMKNEVAYIFAALDEANINFDIPDPSQRTHTLAAYKFFDEIFTGGILTAKNNLVSQKGYASTKAGFKIIDNLVSTAIRVSANIYSRLGIAIMWGFLRKPLFSVDDFSQTKKLISKSEGFVTGKRNLINLPYLGNNLNQSAYADFTFSQGRETTPASYYETMYESRFIIVYDELYKDVFPEVYLSSNYFNEDNEWSRMTDAPQKREISKLMENTLVLVKPFEETMNLSIHDHGINEFFQRTGNHFGNLGFVNVVINTTSTQCVFMHPAVLLGATLFEYSDVTINSLLMHHSASMLYAGFQEILRRMILFKRADAIAPFGRFVDAISSSESYISFDENVIYRKSNNELANKSRLFLQSLYDTIKVGLGDKITYSNSNVKKSFVSVRKPIMEYFANISDANSAEVVNLISFNKRLVEISEISIIQVAAFSQSYTNLYSTVDLLSLQMKTASELKKLTNLVSEDDRMKAIASLTRYDTKNKKSIEMGKSGFKLYPAGQWKRLDTKGKVTFQIEEPRTPFQIFMQTEHIRSVVKKFKSIIPGVDANSIITALWKHPIGPIWQLKDYCISKSMQEISDKAPLWTLYFTLMDLADYSKIDMIDRDIHGGLLIKAAPSGTIMSSIINDYLVADMPTASRQALFNEYNEHNNKLFKTMGLLDKTGRHFAESTIEPVSASSYGVPDFKKNKIKSTERPKLIKDSETVAMSEVGGALADYFSKNTLAIITKSLGQDNEYVQAFRSLINVNEDPGVRKQGYDKLYEAIDLPELQHLKRYLPMMKSLLPIDNLGKAGKKVTLTPSKTVIREAIDKEASRASFNALRERDIKKEYASLMNLIND